MHKTTVHRVGPARGLPSSGGWYGFSVRTNWAESHSSGQLCEIHLMMACCQTKRETGQCNAEGVLVVDVFEYTILQSVGAVRRRRRLPLYSILLKSRRRRQRSA